MRCVGNVRHVIENGHSFRFLGVNHIESTYKI